MFTVMEEGVNMPVKYDLVLRGKPTTPKIQFDEDRIIILRGILIFSA